MFLKLETVKSYTNSEGVKRCVPGSSKHIQSLLCVEAGGKHLRGTQAYPGNFGLKARGFI